MDTHRPRRPIAGLHLRYVLTLHLADTGESTIAGLVAAVEQAGFALPGRPSKTISDALRWEVRRGRVVRTGRGRYGPGTMPRQTRSWMRKRIRSLRQEALCEVGTGDHADAHPHADADADAA